MVKVFSENHEPLELELRDRFDKRHAVQTLLMTSGDIKQIELIGKGKLNKKFATETEKVHAMMKIYCGKTAEFWGNFSFDLLNNVLVYLNKEIKKKQQKPDG